VQLEEAASDRLRLGGLVGHSVVMRDLFRQILRAAASEASILITGESGTGKELVARALHDNSSRAKGPYIRVHCAAFPEQLLEGELFGHARGAFTGAATAREGRFEAAHGGTLLLDEIGEVPLSVQVKLLRVLQEREIERLGENQTRKVDVRIIAANAPGLAGHGQPRRIPRRPLLPVAGASAACPALRERREDIPLLVSTMLTNMLERHPGRDIQLSNEALDALGAYSWPGNVRELVNALEYAMVHVDGTSILRATAAGDTGSRPPGWRNTSRGRSGSCYATGAALLPRSGAAGRAEKEILIIALKETGGNKAAAAEKLGMSRTTLWKKLKQYGID